VLSRLVKGRQVYLELGTDQLLSSFAFNFNLRLYATILINDDSLDAAAPWWGGAGCQYQTSVESAWN